MPTKPSKKAIRKQLYGQTHLNLLWVKNTKPLCVYLEYAGARSGNTIER